MKALPITLTLIEPLLAPTLNGDPNSAVSYPFIPGSLIRGAIASRLAETNSDIAVTERNLLFNGKTRFLNAYPTGENDQRSLPAPLSWRREKEQYPLKTIFDLSTGGKPKQGRKLSQPFYSRYNGAVALYDPEKYFNVHTHREDRVMGRATEGSGAVFRYEAIAPGQTFVGTILFDDDNADTDLFDDAPLLLGGSRSTAYGRVTITPDQEKINWREIGGQLGDITDIPAGYSFILTLLSDLVMQNEHGQYSAHVTDGDVARWFGLSPQDISITQAYKAESMVGGFNHKWGLPLSQTPALRAGTVFVLKAATIIAADVIRKLEEKGIGKRVTEGFGRIAVVPKEADSSVGITIYDADQEDTDRPEPEQIILADAKSRALAQTMYARLLSARVDDALAIFVNQKAQMSATEISPNQLSRLRVKVRGQLTNVHDNSLKEIGKWLDRLRPTGRKQYEQARINGEQLLTWLTNRVSKPTTVWNVLEIELEQLPLAQTDAVDVKGVSTGQFAIQTSLRLIDGVLAKMAKMAKEARDQ